MRKLIIEKIPKQFFSWAIALTLLISPSLTLAGDLDYPSIVYADQNGNWSVEINISNTDDPQWESLEYVNILVTEVGYHYLGNRKWKITLAGELINKRKNGKIVFRADPEGLLAEGVIMIISLYRTPTLTQWGLLILTILVAGGSIWLMLKKRRVIRV